MELKLTGIFDGKQASATKRVADTVKK